MSHPSCSTNVRHTNPHKSEFLRQWYQSEDRRLLKDVSPYTTEEIIDKDNFSLPFDPISMRRMGRSPACMQRLDNALKSRELRNKASTNSKVAERPRRHITQHDSVQTSLEGIPGRGFSWSKTHVTTYGQDFAKTRPAQVAAAQKDDLKGEGKQSLHHRYGDFTTTIDLPHSNLDLRRRDRSQDLG
uniref:Uncharacterized protein n=1 Tax=Octactis speculum TaxID=3111310 RepID=A0A7S2H323_9STRA|mmetsp:Transcript_60895/g.83625  ORF Transcript_60895/g.83625 Transcript_60895/m.83625 type:complete len:186 (+) Transcript_60895:61-618(+)|eukprot:CAMPEP_0185773114 /NCGR_PEP_ID=MMETSP1174-20130828/72300_1 /TAXON_ID=35687 /ORGANISM="Dictyocha speculum, Strain CCMP1381" /LENGTH=185 /DNA_ID=CAMNT_0028459665 /DNA_START=59 /DNA_END=616 /DNA_ORIENTATION=+